MAYVDSKQKVMHAKLVYYGPGMCGKTTNLEFVSRSSSDAREMMSLATEGDRTIFFDFFPLDLGTLRGMNVRFKLYTVPGQVRYNQTRKMVLKDVDGVVFVADSQPSLMDANVESLSNLFANFKELGIRAENVAIVLQYNKRDLPNVLSVEQMNAVLNKEGYPTYEASAVSGAGVIPTLKAACKLVLQRLSASVGGLIENETGWPSAGGAPAKKSVPPAAAPAPKAAASPTPPAAAKSAATPAAAPKRGATPKPAKRGNTPTPLAPRESAPVPPDRSAERLEAIEKSLAQIADRLTHFEASQAERAAPSKDDRGEALTALRGQLDAVTARVSETTAACRKLETMVREELATRDDFTRLAQAVGAVADIVRQAPSPVGVDALRAESTRVVELLTQVLPGRRDVEALRAAAAAASGAGGAPKGQDETPRVLAALKTSLEGQMEALRASLDHRAGELERLRADLAEALRGARSAASVAPGPPPAPAQPPPEAPAAADRPPAEERAVEAPAAASSVAPEEAPPPAEAPVAVVAEAAAAAPPEVPPPEAPSEPVAPAEEAAAPPSPEPAPAAEEPAAAAPPAEPPPDRPPEKDYSSDPRHQNAARIARVMVADLLMYHKQDVEEGVRNGDFFDRIKEALADMRATYDARVGSQILAEKDYLAPAIDGLLAKKRKELGLE